MHVHTTMERQHPHTKLVSAEPDPSLVQELAT